MNLTSIINMYKPNMVIPFCTSLILFFLYMMLQLIELNHFVKQMDVADKNKITRATMVFAYIVGYFSLLFKLILQLITIVVLVTLVWWLIIAMAHMLRDSQQGGGGSYSSAAHLRGGEGADIGEKMKKAGIRIATYIMGVLFTKNFFFMFLFVIPIFLLFFTIMYAQFFDKKIMLKRNADKSQRILDTNHNFMIMMITTLCSFTVLYLGMTYLMTMLKMSDSESNSEQSQS